MKFKRITWFVVFVFCCTIIGPLLMPAPAQAAGIDDLVTEMNSVYQYLDNDKQYLTTARENLQNLVKNDPNGTGDIAPVIDPFINAMKTTQAGQDAIAALGGEDATKQKFVSIAKDLGDLYYTSDSTELNNRLSTFKDTYRSTFWTLFGNDITLERFAGFLTASRSKFTTAINTSTANLTEQEKADLGFVNPLPGNPTTLKEVVLYGGNDKLVIAMPILVKYAMQAAINDGYGDLNSKLSNIGWNTDLLIQQHNVLAGLIDTNRDAELALARASVRSQAQIAKGGVTINPVDITRQDTIQVGADVNYDLTIMDYQATGLVDWDISDSTVAELALFDAGTSDESYGMPLTPKKAGDVVLTAYRAGGNPATDWILKLNVTVGGAAAKYGDLNGDGDITVADAVIVVQIALGNISPTANERLIANVNGDDDITVADAVDIVQRALGNISKFVVEP